MKKSVDKMENGNGEMENGVLNVISYFDSFIDHYKEHHKQMKWIKRRRR